MKTSIRRYYKSERVDGLKVLLSHEEAGFYKIQQIVRDFQPCLIIELGTWYKGLSLVLHEALPSADLFSFDKYPAGENKKGAMSMENLLKVERSMDPRKVHFFIRDVLVPDGDVIVNALCMARTRKILYCDNGNKIKEVCTYGPRLSSGDLMGVHDWGTEIDDSNPMVKYTLDAFFYPHDSNAFFVEKECLTRFFVRK